MSCSSSLVKYYSIEPRDQIFVKGYGLLSFAKNLGKKLTRNVSSKYWGTTLVKTS